MLIVGGGVAGCAAALWLHEFQRTVLIVEQNAQLCGNLEALDFQQHWVLGAPQATPRELAKSYRTHIQERGIETLTGAQVTAINKQPTHWQMGTANHKSLDSKAIVLATGLQPIRPSAFFSLNQMEQAALVFDAIELTQQRHFLVNCQVLILGGGDNAIENALYLAAQNKVVVCSRSPLRASG